MSSNIYQPFVITVKDRCRVCYTCVRECPAKAIKIADGQAEVIPDRCIGCGNCVRVCSQRAKKAVSSVEPVRELLAKHSDVTAIIAPSFAAEFADMDYEWFVGMVKALGFKYVNDVAFGADLVADRVNKLVKMSKQERYISTACPAVFGYVKRYHPDLIESLMPIVSPMIAAARALRKIRGDSIKVVFIGPCIAKKAEACSDELTGEIDEVLTFEELRQMFQLMNLEPDNVEPCDFDPPYGYKGALFPLNRGLLQSAGIEEDLVDGGILSASGRTNFINAIMEFSSGEANAKFLDVLCCDGCIMGPGMTTSAGPFRKRALVSRYVRRMMELRDKETWSYYASQLADLDLSRKFRSYDRRMEKPSETAIREIMERLGKFEPKDELNCGACGYETCREHAIAIYQGLAEQEMCLPYAIEQLHHTVAELAVSNQDLASTREALIQSEKMASMGQLSAGIAHEINNPLGVVLMYAHLLLEDVEPDSDAREDLQMIADYADRAKKIVSGLLNFARQHEVDLKPVNVPTLIQEHLRSMNIQDRVNVRIDDQMQDPVADLDTDQMIQVITNLVSNAVTAMADGGTLTVSLTGNEDEIQIAISDTGTGIPKDIVSKVFDPFFTTKKAGKGTGLGLAITYGIVKMHRGHVTVTSNANPEDGPTGTTFTVTVPRMSIR